MEAIKHFISIKVDNANPKWVQDLWVVCLWNISNYSGESYWDCCNCLLYLYPGALKQLARTVKESPNPWIGRANRIQATLSFYKWELLNFSFRCGPLETDRQVCMQEIHWGVLLETNL